MATIVATVGTEVYRLTPTPATDVTKSTTFGGRVYNWLDQFLDKQLGIFRINKLGKDTLEFLEKGCVFLFVASKEAIKSRTAPWIRVFAMGVDGTTLAHAFTSIKFNLLDKSGNIHLPFEVETVKKVTDVVTAFMFAAITFCGMTGLLTAAKLILFAGDSAELYLESSNFSKMKGRADTAVVESGQTPVSVEGKQAIRTAQTVQLLKMVKVVCAVAAGVLFVASLAVPFLGTFGVVGQGVAMISAYVPTAVGSIFTAELFALVNASLSLIGSVCAVAAEYQKSTIQFKVEV